MAKILVIDDDPWILEFFVTVLEKEGHEVFKAENGTIGIELYHQHQPDLLITDMVMPDKDGLATIMEINRQYPHPKVIAISGGGAIEPERYLNLAKTIGVLYTLQKPVSRAEFLSTVEKALTSQFY